MWLGTKSQIPSNRTRTIGSAPQSPHGEWRTVNGKRVNRQIDDEDDEDDEHDEHEQEVEAPNIDTYF